MLRRLPKISLWSLATLLSLAVLALLLLVYTQAGLRFALARLPAKMGETRLEIRDVRGTLAGGFTAARVVVTHPRAVVRAEGFAAHIDVLPLLWQTIDVRDARLGRVRVQVFSRKQPSRRPLRFLPPFMSIRAEDVRIASATLIATNGKRFDGTEAVASGTVRSKTIRLYETRVRMDDLRGGGQIVIGAANPIELSGRTNWTFSPPGQPVWTASVDIDGDLANLPINANFTAPFRAVFNGSAVALNAANWRWGGKGRIDNLDLRAWGGGGLLGKVTGQLDIRGDRSGFVGAGPLQSAGLAVGDIDMLFEGSYANRVIATRRLAFTHRASRARIDGAGSIRIESGGPRLALRGRWQDFRWPLIGASADVRSANGEYTLAGVWPYALSASGPLQVLDFEPFQLRVAGRLGTDRLQIDSGTAALLGSETSVVGEARWSPEERWQLSGAVRDLDTARLRSALPGRVSFNYRASGTGYGGSEDLDAEFVQLTGRVRGASARGGGRLQRRGAEWRFDAIKLAAGGLALDLDGVIAPQERNLRFRIAASDLAIIDPDARGKVRAEGSWRGPDTAPVLTMEASGRDVEYGQLRVGQFDASAAMDTRPGKRASLTLRAQELRFGERRMQRMSFVIDGPSEASNAQFEAQVGGTVLRSVAAGAFDAGVWRGRWRSVQVDDPGELHLKLVAPADIRVGPTDGHFDQFCLRGTNAQLCPQLDWGEGGWNGTLVARNLPLASLTSGLTSRVLYDGTIGGELVLRGRSANPLVGSLRARLRDARVRRQRTRGREDVLALGSGDLALEADAQRLKGTLKLDALDLGFVDARLDATRTDGSGAQLAWSGWPLQANLQAESRTLSFLSMLSQDIDRVGGRLTADLRFDGTLGAPRADGELRVADGELDLYAINLAVRKLDARASIAANKLSFESASRVGDGSLNADGDLYWQQGQLHGNLRLRGNNLLAVNVPEARILASPDLQFGLAGRRITVTGEVRLPEARIVPTDLAGAVLTSSDEVRTDQQTVDDKPQSQVAANVRMTLGDQVTIDTFGLSGRLTGSIQTRTADDGSTHATGELNVAEGKYAAFGRRLDIERGRLQFSGGLVSDPAVDIRATKQYPEVVAGVNVRGTLRAPRMTFFSTPSLPQSQIVSLILAGGNIDRSQDPNRAGAARDELLAQGSAIIAQQIGSRVGVDDVSIEQSLDNTTALVLGKYLSPRLYVSYGISLAESINTLKMRYALDDRWTIRTEAGKERSAELVYTIEK